MASNMAEMDEELLNHLKLIGAPIGEEVQKLGQLDSMQVLSSVQLLLSSTGLMTSNVDTEESKGAVAKYALAARLAEMCNRLKPIETISYETFLFGKEQELRRLLHFLRAKSNENTNKKEVEVKKPSLMPKPKNVKFPSKSEKNDENTNESQENDDERDDFEVESSIDFSNLDELVKLVPRESRNAVFNHFSYKKIRSDYKGSKTKVEENVKKERHDINITVERDNNDNKALDETDNEPLINDEQSLMDDNDGNVQVIKSIKDEHLIKENEEDKIKDDFVTANNSELEDGDEEEEERTEDNNEHLEKEEEEAIAEMENDLATLEELENRLNNDISKINDEIELKRKEKSKEEDEETIKGKIERSKAKMNKMSNDYEKLRTKLEKERNQLKASLRIKQNENGVDSSEKIVLSSLIVETQRRLGETRVHLESQKRLMTSLSINNDSRSNYIRRINDISASVQRQRGETQRVWQDVKKAQREINNLEGKFQRTVEEIDAKVIQLAQDDAVLRPSYGLLQDIRESCQISLANLAEMGRVRREMIARKEQIALFKGIDGKLENIDKDCQEIYKENERIREEILMLKQ